MSLHPRSRSALAALALLLALAVLAACAPPAPQDSAQAGADAGGDADAVTDDGTTGASAGSGDALTFMNDKTDFGDALDVFEQYGERPIEVDIYSDTTSYQQVIMQSLPTSEAPALMTWWSGYRMEDLAASDQLMDLTELWEERIADGTLSADVGEAFTYEDRVYGVPLHVSYWPVFYNVEVFEEHGIEVPTTWDEVVAAADTLVEAGVTPFFATTDGRWPAFIWFEEFLIRTDPDFYDRLMAGEESYTDPLVLDALQEWGEWLERGYFTPLDTPMDERVTSSFADGEVAMMLQGTWWNNQFRDAELVAGEDYDAFILPNRDPELDEQVVIFETAVLGAPANSPEPEASLDVLEWWVGAETQSAWSEALGDTPAVPGVEAPDAATQSVVDAVEGEDYRLMQRYWEASPTPIVEAAVDELSRFMLNPDEAEEVLERIEDLARSEWDQRS